MMYDRSLFSTYCELKNPIPVKLGNGNTVDAIGIGTVDVVTLHDHNFNEFSLQNVYHVPDLTNNFVSVSAMTRVGNVIAIFDNSGVKIQDKQTLETLGYGILSHNVYLLACTINVPLNFLSKCNADADADDLFELWHRRLGHCSSERMMSMANKQMVIGMDKINGKPGFCNGCIKGKLKRAPFPEKDGITTKNILDLIHTDVCGPFSTNSAGGAKYFVTFIDDFSRMRSVFPIAKKSDVFEALREFEAMVTTQTRLKIKAIRSDCGGEYLDHRVKNWMKQKGIRHERSVPHAHQQNGVSERTNRILCEMAVSMMEQAGVDRNFWAEAISAACYISNRLPTKATGVTPYEKWYGEKPNVNHLRIWGCMGYVLKTGPEKEKLTSKVKKMRFVGYDAYNKNAYRMWDEEKRRLYIRRDIVFLENDLNLPKKEIKLDASNDQLKSSNEEEHKEETNLRRSQRKTQQPDRFSQWATEEEMQDLDTLQNSYMETLFNMTTDGDPKSLKEAMMSDEAEKWKAAVDEELNSHEKMATWTLVPPSNDSQQNIVDCKWIFKRKTNEFGEISRYKARLVARGFSQQYGVDYHETFAPVVRLNTFRSLIALAVHKNMVVHQMDVKTAFLNGDLNETVYMKQPPGMEEQGKENWVCKLNRSIYGLKQSSRQWNIKFKEVLEELGFTQSMKDTCLYFKKDPLVFISIYVDDTVIAAESLAAVEDVKKQLAENFEMCDIGRLRQILGMKIDHGDNGEISLSQENYIRTLLKRFKLEDMKIYSTPSEHCVTLRKHGEGETSELVNQQLYQSMVGGLMYCAIQTRPDIQYAVNIAARFCSKPNKHHMTAVKRIFGYLKGTVDFELKYEHCEEGFCGYSDADFARDIDDRKSTTGYMFKLSGGAISWYSGKQKSVSVSTANAEYIALGEAAREGLFFKQLFAEMGVEIDIEIFEDNQAAIAIAKNPVYYSKQKHIDVQYHFIRELVQSKQIKLTYCPTETMTADLFTKPLVRSRFQHFRNELGLHETV